MSAALGAEPLLRLLQLASQSLPVGAYAYSQGLESAVEAGWVKDEASLSNWLQEQLSHSIGRVDLPVFARFHDAACRGDESTSLAWSQRLIAMRETSELVADDCDRGRALARLLHDLGIDEATPWLPPREAPFAALERAMTTSSSLARACPRLRRCIPLLRGGRAAAADRRACGYRFPRSARARDGVQCRSMRACRPGAYRSGGSIGSRIDPGGG